MTKHIIAKENANCRYVKLLVQIRVKHDDNKNEMSYVNKIYQKQTTNAKRARHNWNRKIKIILSCVIFSAERNRYFSSITITKSNTVGIKNKQHDINIWIYIHNQQHIHNKYKRKIYSNYLPWVAMRVSQMLWTVVHMNSNEWVATYMIRIHYILH